ARACGACPGRGQHRARERAYASAAPVIGSADARTLRRVVSDAKGATRPEGWPKARWPAHMAAVPMHNSAIRGSMDSIWIWASVSAAFFQALRYAGLKVLNQRLSTQVTTYVRILFTLPILIVYLVGVLWWTGAPLPELRQGL